MGMSVGPQTWAPGVHLEEAFRRAPDAFETGVPAFLGRLSTRGALLPPFAGSAESVFPLDYTAWSALEAREGARWASGYLGFAVRGFFENGGRRCYLLRLGAGGIDLGTISALEALEDFDLVCAPDTTPASAQQQLLVDGFKHQQRCFLILDPPPGGPATLASLTTLRSVNAALYSPWIKVRDACPDCLGTGQLLAGAVCSRCVGSGQGLVPPSGHLAGVYSRTDQRIGVHKAPANEVIEGVLDLELHLDDAAVATLNRDQGVNCLRALPGRGIRAWGARTLAAPLGPDFMFVNTRRIFLSVSRWLEQAMADVAFEPNELGLWIRITRDVGAFLEGLFRRGALTGASAAEAFYVKCNAETNPSSVRAAGQVVTEVGLALARPSEFVVVRLVSSSSGTAVSGAPGS